MNNQKNNRFTSNKKQIIISSLVTLLPMLIGFILYNFLPERMAIHWNSAGNVDGTGSKLFVIVALPLILLAAHLLCIFFTSFDKGNKNQNSKVMNLIYWIIPVTSLIMCSCTYAIALGSNFDIELVIRLFFGLLFMLIGNLMPKCKQNYTIGIKVPWTLNNEENWHKTHRFAGKLWFVGGLFFLATLFIPMKNFFYLMMVAIMILAFAPMLYSFLYHKKQLKNGVTYEKNSDVSKTSKKMTIVALIVTGIILIGVVVMFVTADYSVTFGDTSLSIDANFWSDVTVDYDKIDSVEYREKDDPDASKTRNLGYGDFSLLMGEFKNDEFGRYTRYSHISCDSCVVITIGDGVLVLNGENDTETKDIYDKLMSYCK